MEVEVVKSTIKIVKNEGSINIISNEQSYYAKGINRVRRLRGKRITREFIVYSE